ncbi:MAG: hypothetical protein DHS20C18_37560 [Saprospiraceae bacterium]|nr:MAG: hypothetical protein DHS20C18_37560 [Saprospiraceae bacterium]
MKRILGFTLTFIALFTMGFLAENVAAQQRILGTTDINVYLEEAPGLPNTLQEAAKRAFGANPLLPDLEAMDNFYKPFEDKVNGRIKDYNEYARNKMQSHQSGTSEEAYREQAMKDVNSNPIIANMGGYEKVSKMSEEEAKAAATQATAEFVADPFAANGMQSAGMKGLYQKVMSDPEYAKKFEKMSEAERGAELRKFMANDQPMVKTPGEMQQEHSKFAQQQQDANQIRNAQLIQMKLTEWQQKLSEVGIAYGQKIDEAEQAGNTHKHIDADFQQKYIKIPEVPMGEMREKDPAIVGPLRLETAEKHKTRATLELKQYAVALNELRVGYQVIASEYLDFIEKNGSKVHDGLSVKDIMHGMNTELQLVGFESGLIGAAIELSNRSRELVKKIAMWEQNYLQVKQTYQM